MFSNCEIKITYSINWTELKWLNNSNNIIFELQITRVFKLQIEMEINSVFFTIVKLDY
jgi:hypothetical protein